MLDGAAAAPVYGLALDASGRSQSAPSVATGGKAAAPSPSAGGSGGSAAASVSRSFTAFAGRLGSLVLTLFMTGPPLGVRKNVCYPQVGTVADTVSNAASSVSGSTSAGDGSGGSPVAGPNPYAQVMPCCDDSRRMFIPTR
jgi:hypothetical protein